jgi:hypothetical protein
VLQAVFASIDNWPGDVACILIDSSNCLTILLKVVDEIFEIEDVVDCLRLVSSALLVPEASFAVARMKTRIVDDVKYWIWRCSSSACAEHKREFHSFSRMSSAAIWCTVLLLRFGIAAVQFRRMLFFSYFYHFSRGKFIPTQCSAMA